MSNLLFTYIELPLKLIVGTVAVGAAGSFLFSVNAIEYADFARWVKDHKKTHISYWEKQSIERAERNWTGKLFRYVGALGRKLAIATLFRELTNNENPMRYHEPVSPASKQRGIRLVFSIN